MKTKCQLGRCKRGEKKNERVKGSSDVKGTLLFSLAERFVLFLFLTHGYINENDFIVRNQN